MESNACHRYLHDSAQEHAVAVAALNDIRVIAGGERKRRRGISSDDAAAAAAAAAFPLGAKRQKTTTTMAMTMAPSSRPRPALPPVQQPLPLNLGGVSTFCTYAL